MARLPVIVDELARDWSLQVGRPFQPRRSRILGGAGPECGRCARRAEGRLAPRRGVARGGRVTRMGRSCRGSVVRCGRDRPDERTAAGNLRTRHPLSRVLRSRQQDAVVAGLLRRLWIQPPAGHPFRALESMCAWWADEFEDKYAAASGPRLDQGLARAGIELFRALPSTAERSVLLATDLHPDNVLAAEREPWLVIDPKPYVGDPTYDPLQHMVHFPHRLRADPVGFVRRMADLLGLDV